MSGTHQDLLDRIDRLDAGRLALLEQRLLALTGEDAGTSGDRLIAYVSTSRGTTPPGGDELRQHVASRLPAFMVPSAFEVVASFPELPNGKVDRHALARARGGAAVTPAAAGVTPVEAKLMRVWGDVLDVREIRPDHNFFEHGGHSLLVPRLVERIQANFGITLPLGAVFQTPTIRGLAALIEAGNPSPEWRSLVGIRENGARPPLYMVHGLGGEIGYFYNLAQYLSAEQPVFGLQAPAEPIGAIEAMASRYLEEVRRHQPSGPYHLGGYCVGGCVAYEMARQLEEAGETVNLLAIVDSVMPGPRPLTRQLRSFLTRPPASIVETIVRRVRGTLKGQYRNAPEPIPTVFKDAPEAFHAAASAHYEAQLRYAPKPYRGNMWLFRSRDNAFEDDLGWGLVVRGRLEVRNIPGPHSDVLKEPYLKEAARQISAVVDAATARR